MPDIIDILTKRGKLILLLTLSATVLALLISIFRPKEYLATATAVPANSALSDKARLFNNNIEALYPELGSPDELDRIEGTAKLDTIFLAVTDSLHLAADKNNDAAQNGRYKAAMSLKKHTDIRRSAYGELKISVWNQDAAMAASLANALLAKLNDIHEYVQNQNNARILQRLRENLMVKQVEMKSLEAGIADFKANPSPIDETTLQRRSSTDSARATGSFTGVNVLLQSLQIQLREHHEMIGKYELAVATSPQVLVPVEYARPALSPDKPNVLRTTLFAFGASLLFSFLLVLFLESRRQKT